ncbi:MAG: ATP-binding cassette domain-containing protein [Coriobacteriales bacterium]
MIEVQGIRKSYKTGSFEQKALDGVSIVFRDNEFVAVLGQSGSGKTTLLNILGGLDHADEGDLIINGISTKEYKSRDWDTYRNHRIGFIFQSYNLIPHQSVLSNVELALTLAGISRDERHRRAKEALVTVGLEEHMHKRPNQLSGGQMQRVAIARALVNDPEIVLADEPTGALDTETGLQVMDLLQEIAKDRLVIMVTHNPELAEQYATRIVRLSDGKVIGDTMPVAADEIAAAAPAIAVAPLVADETAEGASEPISDEPTDTVATEAPADVKAAPAKKASMSFLTALALSFNNLMTKKGRTIMTALAGSIGIIGIAAILALSNGVNNYIADTEESALTSYPLTVTQSSFDMTNLLTATMSYGASDDSEEQALDLTKPIPETSIMGDMFAKVKNNDLVAFRKFLESDESGIKPYVSTIQYAYDVEPHIYKTDTSDKIIQLNPSKMGALFTNGVIGSSFTLGGGFSAFTEMLDDRSIIEDQMELVAGEWPDAYDECLLVLNSAGDVSDYTLYSLGVYDTTVMDKMTEDLLAGKDVEVPKTENTLTYEDALKLEFSVVPATDLNQYNSGQKIWSDISSDKAKMRKAIDDGIKLKVVGLIKPKSGNGMLSEGIAYTSGLTHELMKRAGESDIVKDQKDAPEVDVFSGKTFDELLDEESAFDMDSLFTIDEGALANAFKFDMSGLSGMSLDPGTLNLDSSGLSIDSEKLLQAMDSDTMSQAFGADAMAKMLAGAPQFDVSSSGLIDDTSQLTPEQQAIIAPVTEQAGKEFEKRLNAAMDNYMQNQFAPYLSSAMQAMMSNAAQAMANNMATALQAQLVAATQAMGSQLSEAIGNQLQSQMGKLQETLASGFSFDPNAFASAFQMNMSEEDLNSLLTSYLNADDLSYDGNMAKLGYAELENPHSISIYAKDFEAKQSVIDIIDGYNDAKREAKMEEATIQYNDIAGTLMSSVTDIVNTISLVLIAFVSISLVVSSIMIGIITYISVLERKKEIGILRAMGASKRNIANIFNAETFIEGLFAGVLAIVVVLIASVPVNIIVERTHDVPNIMALPPTQAIGLILISIILTFIAGLIPSQAASRRDPVEALRSE